MMWENRNLYILLEGTQNGADTLENCLAVLQKLKHRFSVPCICKEILNHWTSREVPEGLLRKEPVKTWDCVVFHVAAEVVAGGCCLFGFLLKIFKPGI